jgi:TusA-related sulfurtransferase
MEQLRYTSKNTIVDFVIDITKEVCPLTFVKTKLLIEKMRPGQVAQVRLQGTEPLENVPRSVRELGHTILSLEPEDPTASKDDVHTLIIQKEAD